MDVLISTTPRQVFTLLDSGGNPVTGLGGTFTVEISKNGGAFVLGTGLSGETGLGWYYYDLLASETDTLGTLALAISGTGAVQVNLLLQVVESTQIYFETSPGGNSYGTTSGVQGLVPRYTNSLGAFDATTRPTLVEVIYLIDQISSLLNMVLAREGFQIPIIITSATPILAAFVEEEVSAICEGINGSGRFGPGLKGAPRKSRFLMIQGDIQDFLTVNALGLERMGASRTYSPAWGIGFRDANQTGDPTFPIFERDSFIRDSGFRDWDGWSRMNDTSFPPESSH